MELIKGTNSFSVFQLLGHHRDNICLLAIGAICLPINYRLTASEVLYIVNDSEPKVVFVDQEFNSLWNEVLKDFDENQLKTISFNSLTKQSDYEDIVQVILPLKI